MNHVSGLRHRAEANSVKSPLSDGTSATRTRILGVNSRLGKDIPSHMYTSVETNAWLGSDPFKIRAVISDICSYNKSAIIKRHISRYCQGKTMRMIGNWRKRDPHRAAYILVCRH